MLQCRIKKIDRQFEIFEGREAFIKMMIFSFLFKAEFTKLIIKMFYFQRIFYRQEKSKESLIDFMLKQVRSSVITLQKSNLESILEYEDYKSRPWLVIFYEDTDEVDDLWITQKKLSAIFVSASLCVDLHVCVQVVID